MKMFAAVALILFSATICVAQDASPADAAPAAARPEDVSSPEALVKADLECLSGGVGVPRQWARNYSLYAPHARVLSAETDPATGKVNVVSSTEQEFARRSDAWLVKSGFSEWEMAHKTFRYGNVATVMSSYDGKTADGKSTGRGVNIYQMYFDGTRWWITSVIWDIERPDNPVPKELLAKKK
jgi:hypothetical protein